ncbi:MAG: hypothetical protein IJ223_04675 [Clostridia bacterium]|nr:hypothetical protein [Clostridia bacterium]
MAEEKSGFRKRMKEIAVSLGVMTAVTAGMGIDNISEAASNPPPKDNKTITHVDKKKEFNEKYKVQKSNLKAIQIPYREIRCATKEENDKMHKLQQIEHNLRTELLRAKESKDTKKYEEITIKIIEIKMEMDKVMKPIRERQAANPVEEKSK